MKYINKKGYSIIVAVLVIGFLLVLAAGILNLIMIESKDTRGELDYIKAFSAAEGASELALLKIKQDGYGVKDSISTGDSREDIFGTIKKDAKINYDLNYIVSSYSGKLEPAGYDIIPLFYIENGTEHKVTDLTLTVSTTDTSLKENLAWNIVSNSGGIVGLGDFDKNTSGEGKDSDQKYFTKKVDQFLSFNSGNYLMLFNVDENNTIEYNLQAGNSQFFTLPRADILSSAKVGKYKINLQTHLDNTEFLGLLKYSLYNDN